ncbi:MULTISPECIES: YdcH family protein [Sneathiella]|uniref:YdcH family protein n=1 Tax=Sneathiella TaxID=510690 RepID=UPI00146AB89A|nr:YdcH family protein [Sneathiella aquimaris]
MSHVAHELNEEFPAEKEKIQQLNQSNNHFAKLTEEYHTVNREIHRIETNVAPADEGYEKQLRRQRLALKDEISLMLKQENA